MQNHIYLPPLLESKPIIAFVSMIVRTLVSEYFARQICSVCSMSIVRYNVNSNVK